MNAMLTHQIRDVLIAAAIEFVSLILTPLVPLVVFFRKPIGRVDQIRVYDAEVPENVFVERKALPGWLWWWQTPDEPLPGGMYEPTVRGWYVKWGDYHCSVRWLLRNRLYGLAWAFGKPADDYLDPVHGGIARRGDLWRWWKQIGPFVLQVGWKVHRKDFDAHWKDGPFWAVRFASIRLRRNA